MVRRMGYALRAAFLCAPNRRYSIYWAVRSKLADTAQGLVNHRGARVISISDADSFSPASNSASKRLSKSHRQNPLSIELLVNSTKRFLAKPEYRIQLDELFAEETERVLTQLDGPEFTSQGQWGEASFRARVRNYEAATEALSRMVGVIGRWGMIARFRLSLISSAVSTPMLRRSRTGLPQFSTSEPTPRFSCLQRLGWVSFARNDGASYMLCFRSTIDREDKESLRIVEVLFLTKWRGGHQEWKQIEGLKDRKTPLSDHLFGLFTEWTKSFSGVMPNFELLFERFEVLGSLAYWKEMRRHTFDKPWRATRRTTSSCLSGIRHAQPAPPSAECSCDRQDRSVQPHRVDTFVAATCAPARSRNGLRKRPRSSFQSDVLLPMVGPSKKPTTHESQKN